MGFFDKIVKSFTGVETPSEKDSVWNHIETEEEIESVILDSKKRVQVVYKHSPSCGVSYFALNNLDHPELFGNKDIDLHLIDVIKGRSVSKIFAEQIGVRHESPQVIVITDGSVKWHGSHNSVNAENVLAHI